MVGCWVYLCSRLPACYSAWSEIPRRLKCSINRWVASSSHTSSNKGQDVKTNTTQPCHFVCDAPSCLSSTVQRTRVARYPPPTVVTLSLSPTAVVTARGQPRFLPIFTITIILILYSVIQQLLCTTISHHCWLLFVAQEFIQYITVVLLLYLYAHHSL